MMHTANIYFMIRSPGVMNRQDGTIIATAILWAGEILAMTVLLKGSEYITSAVIVLAAGGAANILILAGTRKRTALS